MIRMVIDHPLTTEVKDSSLSSLLDLRTKIILRQLLIRVLRYLQISILTLPSNNRLFI